MIIKRMDSKEKEIAQLEALLKTTRTPRQRSAMERELKAIETGISGRK
jgi:hypothetical protein